METMIDPSQAFTLLLNAVLGALMAISVGYLTSPATTVLTNLLKFIPFLKNVKAPVITLFVATLLTIGSWVAIKLNFSGYENLLQMIVVIGQFFLQVVLNYQGSKAIYEGSKSREIPVFGSSRT